MRIIFKFDREKLDEKLVEVYINTDKLKCLVYDEFWFVSYVLDCNILFNIWISRSA